MKHKKYMTQQTYVNKTAHSLVINMAAKQTEPADQFKLQIQVQFNIRFVFNNSFTKVFKNEISHV